MSRLHENLYRGFLVPLILIFAPLLRLLPGKLGETFRLRSNREHSLTGTVSSRPLWVHVSSGELEYARPLLRELRQRHPKLPILLTFFSPSVRRAAKTVSEATWVVPLPFDHQDHVSEFLEHYKPRALVVSRTDVWPEFLVQCEQRKIPVILFAATLDLSSPKFRYEWTKNYFAWLFEKITQIHAVSTADADAFKALSPKIKVSILGDTRYDQVAFRRELPANTKPELVPGENDFVFVAGSTWPADDKVLLPAIPQLLAEGVRPVLVPHEPYLELISSLTRILNQQNVPVVLYTKADHWPQGSVLLVDKVGVLFDLYRKASAAFVGNSFVRDRIHSVMEPLASGAVTLMGPRHRNNREALQFKELGFAREIHTTEDVVRELSGLAALNRARSANGRSATLAEIRGRIQGEVARRTGASRLVADRLKIIVNLEN